MTFKNRLDGDSIETDRLFLGENSPMHHSPGAIISRNATPPGPLHIQPEGEMETRLEA